MSSAGLRAVALKQLVRGATLARRIGVGRPVDAFGGLLLERRAAKGRIGSGEEVVLEALLHELGIDKGWVVDIAACDGVTNSNSLALYSAGWPGLALEGDPRSFELLARVHRRSPDVRLARLWVTPGNVVQILRAYSVPEDFAVLSLDIDGYDHFVLAALLDEYRPAVICAEINEIFPPPIKFTVRYDPNYVWAEDHFFGQSLSKLYELGEAHGYSIAELYYNNAFLVRGEVTDRVALTPETAYATGYLERPDRKERFPWNGDVEEIHSLDPEGKIAFIESYFAKYSGRYELSR